MRVPTRRSEELHRASQQQDHQITAAKLQRLKDELARLEKERPGILNEVREAQAMGDLSENAAYTEAKARLRRTDGRIMGLKDRIKYAVVIEEGPDAAGNARVGATVVVEVNGARREYTIVGAQETDPGSGRVSQHSPLGQALLGRGAGETVAVMGANGKEVVYTVLEVR